MCCSMEQFFAATIIIWLLDDARGFLISAWLAAHWTPTTPYPCPYFCCSGIHDQSRTGRLNCHLTDGVKNHIFYELHGHRHLECPTNSYPMHINLVTFFSISCIRKHQLGLRIIAGWYGPIVLAYTNNTYVTSYRRRKGSYPRLSITVYESKLNTFTIGRLKY
jgi:hypothetical protein